MCLASVLNKRIRLYYWPIEYVNFSSYFYPIILWDHHDSTIQSIMLQCDDVGNFYATNYELKMELDKYKVRVVDVSYVLYEW